MLNELFAHYWVTRHGLVVFLGLAIYAIASHTLRQRRHPSAAIAWIISLILLPYLALPLFLMFGNRKLAQVAAATKGHAVSGWEPGFDKSGTIAMQLAAAIGLPNAATFEQLAIHQDGRQALQSLRDIIGAATRTLDVCSFLLGRDVVGDEVARLLMDRARAGVQVRLLIDGIGFYMGGRPNLELLKSAGVQVALFVSPLSSPLRGRTNLRNHRKMVIADGAWMWCGGRNLAAEYFEGDPASLTKKTAWIDLSFDLSGALAQQGQRQFARDWAFALNGVISPASAWVVPVPAPGALSGRLVASGPDQRDDTIYTLLVSGCFTARQRILAVTPYFVPEPTLLFALTLAARRGVSVDLLLPRKSNHRLADVARHPALRELAAAGGKIWLAPAMIHAKAVLIDDDLALVGSANLDDRSLFLNYELMVAFYDASVVQDFAQWVELQRRKATQHHPVPPGLARELVEGVIRWVAFQL